jgi:hypothetical protein
MSDASSPLFGDSTVRVKATHSARTVYHRLENSTTQTPAIAKIQKSSGEIWGGPPNSPTSSVKAYRGALPANARGIEFTTAVAPTAASGTPFEARWYVNTPGVQINRQGFAFIPATVTENTQVP